MLFDQRKPPEAVRRSPVTQAESSEARNTATLAMSSGWPMRAERRPPDYVLLEVAADDADACACLRSRRRPD